MKITQCAFQRDECHDFACSPNEMASSRKPAVNPSRQDVHKRLAWDRRAGYAAMAPLLAGADENPPLASTIGIRAVPQSPGFHEPPPMNENSCDAFSLHAGHRIELVP
jgi:hypothetical protein